MSDMPVYTALLTSTLIIMHIVLTFKVISQRAKSGVMIGDGGDESLLQMIRV